MFYLAAKKTKFPKRPNVSGIIYIIIYKVSVDQKNR